MDFIPRTTKPASHDFGTGQAIENATTGGHGGVFATVLSAVALFFSGLSYYDSTLKAADLTVFVPPMIHYARDGGDVFNIPITVANDGARTGTILAMELTVENLRADAERKVGKFHAAFLGDYPRDDKEALKSFAPISVAGGASRSETVRFYNSGDVLPFVVDDKGEYRLTLKFVTARPALPGFLDSLLRTEPNPLVLDLTLPYLAVQHLAFRNGTIAMFNESWTAFASTASPAAEPAPDAAAPGTPTP